MWVCSTAVVSGPIVVPLLGHCRRRLKEVFGFRHFIITVLSAF